jgi:hypothetical protein
MPKDDQPLTDPIRPFTATLAMLEGGQFQHDAADQLRDLCAALSEHDAQHGKAKGVLTITLNFSMEGGVVDAVADLKVKAPKLKREKTIFWLDRNNGLTQQNPKQTVMDLRSVPAPKDTPRVVPDPLAAKK